MMEHAGVGAIEPARARNENRAKQSLFLLLTCC